MGKPNVLVLAGFGINCEEETAAAFEMAGAECEIVHVNDLVESPKTLDDKQVLVVPGGFSFGDDLGAGKALATVLKLKLGEQIQQFIERDTLVLGVCNGFQVLVALGLLPALYRSYQLPQADLIANTSNRYTVRWVDVRMDGESPWLSGIESMMLPIAHGEGRFYTSDDILNQMKERNMVAFRYTEGEICRHFDLEANPNGSLDDIAGVTDETGRILGMMPHPERAVDFTHLPHWTYLRERMRRSGDEVPSQGPGMAIFNNSVKYFL